MDGVNHDGISVENVVIVGVLVVKSGGQASNCVDRLFATLDQTITVLEKATLIGDIGHKSELPGHESLP